MQTCSETSLTPRIFDLSINECVKYAKRFRNAEKFITDFRLNYHAALAYHGTNINDAEAEEIKTVGMRVASVDLLKAKALNRFMLPTDNEIDKEKIRTVIEDFFNGKHDIPLQEINFTLKEEPLYGDAYQYLLFGAESMLPLADQLRKTVFKNFRQRMMEFGTPTVIKSAVPVSGVSDWRLQGIWEFINHQGPECCIIYRENLLPVHILELKQVPRPHDRWNLLWI